MAHSASMEEFEALLNESFEMVLPWKKVLS